MRTALCTLLALLTTAGSALAIDDAHKAKGEKVAEKSIAFLRSKQDAATGGWSIPPAGKGIPVLPAVTGLVLNGVLMQPGIQADDPAVKNGVKFMLSYAKGDGGIYDAILPSYNTAICVSTLTRVDSPEAKAAVKAGIAFLRKTQWGESEAIDASTTGAPVTIAPVNKDNPYYGGVGYGRHSRPDLSNLQFVLQAFADAGVSPEDPAVQRALVFVQRCQMIEKGDDGKLINDMSYAKGSRQGGFIYSTGEDEKTAGKGNSETNVPVEETLDDGTKISTLRCYGSMTYAGFRTYLYAGFKKDDPRVKAAMGWISINYTLQENPGIGNDGVYYYLVTFARALDATGSATLTGSAPMDKPGLRAEKIVHDWQNDLVDRLAELQNEDGSFKSVGKRWMEDNPVLITGYGLIALQHALRD